MFDDSIDQILVVTVGELRRGVEGLTRQMGNTPQANRLEGAY
jgi:hypothetical protein